MNFESPSERVIKKIGSLKKPGGCGASLGRAMYMTRRRLVPTMRKNSNKAMFIISTGTLNMGTSHPRAARLLESEQSFQVFSIAIGKNPNKRVLSTVASQPEKSHLIFLRYYGDVFDAVRRTVTLKQRGEILCVFFCYSDNHPSPLPPPLPLRYSKRSKIYILQCSRTSMCHLGDLFSHMGKRPNANVTLIFHVCHGGPFSFLLVSWFINVSHRLSVFKIASVSKYSKCQWSSTKDKEDTIYRKFISLCLFV